MTPSRQPFQHDLLVALQAPTQAWSEPSGQIRAGHGIGGIYHGDVRVISEAVLTVEGEEPETIAAAPNGQGKVRVTTLTRSIDGPGADPTARLERLRTVCPGVIEETLEFTAATEHALTAQVQLNLACDLASMDAIKSGKSGLPAVGILVNETMVRWNDDSVTVGVTTDGTLEILPDGQQVAIRWVIDIEPGTPTRIWWMVTAEDAKAVVQAAPALKPCWETPQIQSDDRRLARLFRQSMDDLAGLQMTTVARPKDVFLAAGAPWFFTLFGRDSLWAARLLLPLGTELAAGTLRTLAALQGTKVDPETAEQPGKILHEIRRETLSVEEGVELPPVYFGTIDATPLWINVLHDAWHHGMPEDEVRELLPALQAALTWMAYYGDSDGDGFLEYRDESGKGLANQGWKDSGDSVQFRDGTLAQGPIALVEVQAYAYEAAISGAALLDAFGLSGGQRWRDWAAELAARFRKTFWLNDDRGPYLGIALDGAKRVVDTVTSNMGHVLGTGILSPEESALIASRLTDSTMSSGFGLRTMSTTAQGYWPLKYHGGSVWPHDTAIAVAGLAKDGHREAAGQLALGLLAAAESFDFRLPELFSGDPLVENSGASFHAVPYPASCRPQAWSAASAVVIASVLARA